VSRPHVLLSVAVSVDGYIDDSGPERRTLSNDADFDRVDQVRADSDAILVGGRTVRTDNPRLIVKSEARQAARVAAGKSPNPLKVTVTRNGDLHPDARFWHHGVRQRPLVYTTDLGREMLAHQLGDLADVVSLDHAVNFWEAVLDDLGARGIERLMVEGGSHIHTAFLARGLADELHVAVAPILVGEPDAPRFLLPSTYPAGRMRLAEVRQIGDVVLLRYLPKERDA